MEEIKTKDSISTSLESLIETLTCADCSQNRSHYYWCSTHKETICNICQQTDHDNCSALDLEDLPETYDNIKYIESLLLEFKCGIPKISDEDLLEDATSNHEEFSEQIESLTDQIKSAIESKDIPSLAVLSTQKVTKLRRKIEIEMKKLGIQISEERNIQLFEDSRSGTDKSEDDTSMIDTLTMSAKMKKNKIVIKRK